MKKLFPAVLLALSICSPATAAYNYPWKTQPPFDIAVIEGYRETYTAGEPIAFTIEGKAQFDVTPENGFSVAATLHDTPRTRTLRSVAAKYDASKKIWQFTFAAPTDSTKAYEIEIHLSCGRDDSQCATTYGRAAQIEKRLPLQVR